MSDNKNQTDHQSGSEDEKDQEEEVKDKQQLQKEDAKVEKELDRVTDSVEDEEMSGENIGNALTAINDKRHHDESKRKAEQQALANVKIKKEDVDLIVQELELPRSRAEKTLRENRGDLIATMRALVNS
ncbi:unnamed protein product [Didymodactylos carnosus]|uniref:Nascent polypeptide-associated complex subunit alpha-like UBA domain-containing protein n=1 Tax=Didymodactylos carnosus TaxID=1234261 RepID=A0A815HIT7_9BILA|nr:unnamed protein product [Didymodactylos carnosus]CAF1351313.1 unnamed protein product [Didymodactylos carnosus]CAF3813533.1 unnamed protein product [Didymodactylos carnosus]CAF4221545.1 unnamed protein product [Didymodactylos carnosus]